MPQTDKSIITHAVRHYIFIVHETLNKNTFKTLLFKYYFEENLLLFNINNSF
jgi:predicted cation transporter